MSPPTPGTPYEGVCNSCGRVIRAALFIDRGEPFGELIQVRCGCAGFAGAKMERVPGTVTTNPEAWRLLDKGPRVDRIIARPRGRLRRLLNMGPRTRTLRGVPTPGAGLDNLLGAVPVPSGWKHMGDVMVPSQAAGIRAYATAVAVLCGKEI